ncbi:unnamed protein product [Brassica rapa subsp. trilocularis]
MKSSSSGASLLSAPSLSRRRPNHGCAHLATVVSPPSRPSCSNHHLPSDNAAVTSARVVAASFEAPESLLLTVAAIFRLKSSGTPQCLLKLQRYPFKSTLDFQLYITDPSYLQNCPSPLDGSQIGPEL